jgi:uncharacterized protein YndB with AHSA1/START domain
MELQVTAEVEVPRPIEVVFDQAVAPENLPKFFRGAGPVPGIARVEIEDGAKMAAGVLRKVHNTDGSVMDERIEALDRPSLQKYRITGGFRFPFTLLVRGARGEWSFTSRGAGTHILWTFTFELTTPLVWPFAAPIARGAFRRAMREALERLRDFST